MRALPSVTHAPRRTTEACACGGGCPRCWANAPIQTKLKISQPRDPSEREADRVAEQVLQTEQPLHNGWNVGANPSREISPYREGAATVAASDIASPMVDVVSRAPGQPLAAEARRFFEERFHEDFSQVRVHTGPEAAASARALGAVAYTLGDNIVFGAGRYAPGTAHGTRLLAHELTHTVQQRRGAGGVIQRKQDEDEMTRRGRRFASRQPPGSQREDVGRMMAARLAVRSIAKAGDASLGVWPNEADGTVRGFQLSQPFRVEFAPNADPANYAIIQWIKGEMYRNDAQGRAYYPASTGLYGRSPDQPWLFTDWIIDTPDADPRFGSHTGIMITVPVTNFVDAPGYIQDTGTLPPGFRWNVHARVGIYAWGPGMPTTIEGWESEHPEPLRELLWGWDIELMPDRRRFRLDVR